MAAQTALMAEVKRREADNVDANRIFTDYSDKLRVSFEQIRLVIDAAHLRGELSQETTQGFLRTAGNFRTDARWFRKEPGNL